MTDETMPATGELRMLALSRIDVQEGFNPRSGRERKPFDSSWPRSARTACSSPCSWRRTATAATG